MDLTMHMIGNILIKVNGNKAAVETYFQAYHRVSEPGRAPYDTFLGGRYLDIMAKREGEWRIQERRCSFDWHREMSDSADWSQEFAGAPFRPGGKKPNDLAYSFLGQV